MYRGFRTGTKSDMCTAPSTAITGVAALLKGAPTYAILPRIGTLCVFRIVFDLFSKGTFLSSGKDCFPGNGQTEAQEYRQT